ncbi:MAG: 50S ribosomal protein L10 [Holosporales bacterium]|jgi:large subunit ribosomal protein L10|nr:50S ribosomal protein L10 [Holosporales bacterium]
MDRQEKGQFVEKIRHQIAQSASLVVVRQEGLTVSDVTELRAQMREEGAVYLVSKNTLSRLAVKGTPFEDATEFLEGPTALTFASSVAAVARALFKYAKSKEGKLTILGGSGDGRVFSCKELELLSQLPSLEVLRSKMMGVLQAPLQRVASVMQAPAGQVARALGAHASKG